MTKSEAVTLRDYVDMRLSEQEKARCAAQQAMELRLENMNEFRNQLREQAGKFFTKEEHNAFMKATDADIRTLRDFMKTMEGKANQSSVNVAYIISGFSLLLTIISLVKEFLR